MTSKRPVISEEIGERLKNVRHHFKMTMDEIGRETKTSRSYLSDFEKGYRLPTTKYLKYLYHKHNVNLNYIFGGIEPMFRASSNETLPTFGPFQQKVEEMLTFLSEMPHALYGVLAYVTEYRLNNKDLIEKQKEGKETPEK